MVGLVRELPMVLLRQGRCEEPPESSEETNADRMGAADRGGRDPGLMGGRCGPGPVGSFSQDSGPVSQLRPRWPEGVGG